MPDTAATLKDVTASPSPAPTATQEPTKTADAAAAASPTASLDAANKDAAEIGQLLLDSGIGRDQINDVLQAPQALAAIRYMVENDPQEFIRSLERTNPGAGENFLDKLSKLYVDRYAKAGGAADTKDGKGADAPNAELSAKIAELSEQLNGMRTESQSHAAQAAQAQIQARFNARVDDLFGQLPADKFPLSTYEKELIRGKLSNDIAADPNAVKRVYNGNFVDVPRTFKSIVEGLANDRKAAADAQKAARERVKNVSFPDLSGGPVELPKDFYDVSDVPLDKLWDEGPFERALTAQK